MIKQLKGIGNNTEKIREESYIVRLVYFEYTKYEKRYRGRLYVDERVEKPHLQWIFDGKPPKFSPRERYFIIKKILNDKKEIE